MATETPMGVRRVLILDKEASEALDREAKGSRRRPGVAASLLIIEALKARAAAAPAADEEE